MHYRIFKFVVLQYCCSLPSWHFTSVMAIHLCHPGQSVQGNVSSLAAQLRTISLRTLVIPTGGQITQQSDTCAVPHSVAYQFGSDTDNCGPFTASLKKNKQRNNRYFSNFTAIATTDLNNSLVQCLSPYHQPNKTDLVGSDTIKIIGQ